MKTLIGLVLVLSSFAAFAENLQPFSENRQIFDILTEKKSRDEVVKMTKAADSGDARCITKLGVSLSACDDFTNPKHLDLTAGVLKIAYDKGDKGAADVLVIYYWAAKDFTNAQKWGELFLAECTDAPEKDRESVEEILKDCKESIAKQKADMANAEKVVTQERVDELKREASAYKNSTLVFKGLYLGMRTEDALTLLRFYVGTVSRRSVVLKDGRVAEFVLTRYEFDKMFETHGVSAKILCETMASAYPIIRGFDTKYEEVSDKDFLVYYCESDKGFLLEIRPDMPWKFFTLKAISALKKGNFD